MAFKSGGYSVDLQAQADLAVAQDATTSLGVAAATSAVATASAAMNGGNLSHLDDGLAALYYALGPQAHAMSGFIATSLNGADHALTADGQYVAVDATIKPGQSTADLLNQLQALGLQQGSAYAGDVGGLLPVAALGQVSALNALGSVHAALSTSHAGTVQAQAVHAEQVDLASNAYPSITGAGVRVGILSDSFNKSGNADTTTTDIASGDLPSDTVVVAEDNQTGTDEGRGMAQLVHDIAPGASIDFATGDISEATFANNIIALAQHGDKVIVDDLGYYDELAYQYGPVAQAIQTVTSQYGVTYFSSAGNDDNTGWEGAWSAGGTFTYNSTNYTSMNFGNGHDYLTYTTAPYYSTVLTIQWDQPATQAGNGSPGSADNLDVFVYSDAAMTKLVRSSVTNNIGGNPVINITLPAPSTATNYYIRVAYDTTRGGGAPNLVRVIAENDGGGGALETSPTNTNAGTVHGHASQGTSIAVAAAWFAQTPAFDPTHYPNGAVEYYSSVGTDTTLFANNGTRLATPLTTAVSITGVDGSDTTFFGDDDDGNGYPNFFGTSAAAPDVAAVAALMLQANPNLTRDDLLHLIQDSALDMDNPYTSGFDTGSDLATGAGLVRADLALGFAQGGVISSTSQTVLQGTHLADVLQGGALNDVITGGAGNDTIYGGMGRDTAVYSGPQSAYSVTRNADGSFTVADTRSGAPDGSDTLSSVEVLQFADGQRQLVPSASDFNADGTSDVVLQSGGTLVDWRILGGAYQGGSTITTQAAGFSVVGKGDLNGDGTGDVVLQNAAGKVVAAILQNGVLQSNTVISAGGSGYKVVGVGDLNNDGTSDLVLQNGGTIVDWTIKNGAYQSGSVITNGAAGYTVVGVGDFNGDGNNDLLVQNGGTILAAFLKNGVLQSSAVISSGAAGYKVVGVGDFDGDGTSDILLQNGDTVVDWIIKNGAYSAGHTLTTAAGGFTVVGVGDYNGDGTSDVLLQNAGTVVDWILGGGAYVTGHVITTGATGYTAG